MKALYFDCFSGISGDMTLGALIDLGIEEEVFLNEIKKLEIGGYNIKINKKLLNGITCTDVNVILDEHAHEGQKNQKGHHHSHARSLKDIEAIIDKSKLNQNVKDKSKKIFREIAQAEAKVHSKSIEEIHFHEVGAVDSIIDIVGASICIDLLKVEKIFSSPLHDGKGFIKCRHGQMPVPVPAVIEMLSSSEIPLITEDVETELITPTGIGIIKTISSGFGNMPAIKIEKVGYGTGKRNTGKFNALRIVMGEIKREQKNLEEIVVLETNIDDMSPEVAGFTMEKLFENGAYDVFFVPVYMKKNRPGTLLTVLSKIELEEKMVGIILSETSSIGVRRSVVQRYCMDRKSIKLKTALGDVRVKIASAEGIKKASVEYEDCKTISKNTGLPLRKVIDTANETLKRHNIE